MSMVACNLFAFMCLLKAPFIKNSHILDGIYFIFLNKNFLDQTWKSFDTEFEP